MTGRDDARRSGSAPDPRTAPLERKYRITARLYDVLDWPWERRYRKWRPDLVGDLEGRVLEVGVGTGRNLPHYPSDVELHAVGGGYRRRHSRLVGWGGRPSTGVGS